MHPLRLRPLGLLHSDGLVAMTLAWSRYDPLAVSLRFPDEGVCWVVSRELLAQGLLGPAGLGDVALLPDLADPDALELVLSSPDGVAGLHLPRADLADFLDATWEQMPSEAEPLWCDPGEPGYPG